MKQYFQIAGAYMGLIVGAGFASGQEVFQFFTSFGLYSLIGTAVATVLFAFLGMQIIQLGSRLKTTSHKDVLRQMCGKYVGTGVDILVTFFLFGVSVVMIAGSGSIFKQQFGISPIIGSFILTVLVIVTLSLNVKKVISIISMMTPLLLIMILIITGYSIFTSNANMEELDAIASSQSSGAPNWLVGGMLYVSYNIVAGFSMLAVIGGTVKSEKVARRGGFLGGLGLGLLLLLINLGMFMHADKIQGVDMPTLFFANELSPMVGFFMALALLGMIFNTAVGMLYAFTARFIQPETPRFKDSVLVIGLLAFGVSFIGFVELVGSVYPITGYLGFVLILAIVLSWISSRRKKDSGKDGNWTKVM
ncbi:YkvI family membrane protein [Virgibacillus alimentarius]|uniref:Membrane protein YkvI n=1 Tax=Virgibacillus alimentarius TaxID=698769 RepID=A0ABS4S8G3_9BACI|nr:membrane protein [Virgibacillus alimentarius]MBP2257781.1 putative membrane protein YkvI [Virgibacillus alimentarius]